MGRRAQRLRRPQSRCGALRTGRGSTHRKVHLRGRRICERRSISIHKARAWITLCRANRDIRANGDRCQIHASFRWSIALFLSSFDFIHYFDGGHLAFILACPNQFHPRAPDWLCFQRTEARLSDDLFRFYRFVLQRGEFRRVACLFRRTRRGSG